jgi:hypothetical protein
MAHAITLNIDDPGTLTFSNGVFRFITYVDRFTHFL